jgi:small ligand-binding sensory domain FIST
MNLFPFGHATHPKWQMAAGLVLAQLRSQMALDEYSSSSSLALLYITDQYSAEAEDILAHLSVELPEITDWSGTVGVGIASNNVEYFDEPAMAVMLCDVPPDQFRIFSGVAPLGIGFEAHTALIHADAQTPDLSELIDEMADRTAAGYLFGGLSSGRSRDIQFAVGGNGNVSGHGAASGVFSGGLSGVAFGASVSMISRVTQGCLPISQSYRVDAVDHNVVIKLNGEPALDVMLRELKVSMSQPEQALLAVRSTLVGLMRTSGPSRSVTDAQAVRSTGNFGNDVLVRHIIGLDPKRRGIAVSERLEVGMTMTFCHRNMQAAKADLKRICAEVREELEPEELLSTTTTVPVEVDHRKPAQPRLSMVGAIYVSCAGRGGAHFGGPSAELQIIRHALGDVPLVGFFAAGEIAHHHLFGYTGVLTVFTKER